MTKTIARCGFRPKIRLKIPFWVFIKINDLKKTSDARSGQLAQTGERKNAARC